MRRKLCFLDIINLLGRAVVTCPMSRTNSGVNSAKKTITIADAMATCVCVGR